MKIKPKNITLNDMDGEPCEYIITRFEAINGFKILSKTLPFLLDIVKNNDYSSSEEKTKDIEILLCQILSYCYRVTKDGEFKLDSKHIIDNHVPDMDTLLLLLKELNDYNSNFFKLGEAMKKLAELKDQASELLTRISNRLSDL